MRQDITDRNNRILADREHGMTYRAIAEKYNLTVPRIAQIVSGRYTKGYHRGERTYSVYRGINNWMHDNKLTYSSLAAMLAEKCDLGFQPTINLSNRLRGVVMLDKAFIDAILTVSHMTYEDAFHDGDNRA